jgi:hypothetical protein
MEWHGRNLGRVGMQGLGMGTVRRGRDGEGVGRTWEGIGGHGEAWDGAD